MAIPKPNIATAAKTATTSAAVNADVLAAAAKQSPLINANQVQNQGTDGSSQDHKPRPGFEGPSPNIPDVSKPAATLPSTAEEQQATLNNHLGLVSKADAMKQLGGVGTSSTPAQSAKDKLTDLMGSTSTNNKPGIEQGFGPSPDGAALAAMFGGGKTGGGVVAKTGGGDVATVAGTSAGQDSNSATTAQGSGSSVMNPMAPYQGGSVGGLLGAVAGKDVKGAPGINGAVGSGMVSDALVTTVAVIGVVKAAADVAKVSAEIGKVPLTAIYGGGGAGLGIVGTATAGVATAALGGIAFGTLVNKGYELGTGSTIGDDWASMDEKLGLGIGEATVAAETFVRDLFSQPDPEKRGSNDNILSQSMLDQLNASKAGKPTSQGGSGDATPVDNGGIAQVVRNGSIAVNQGSINQRNLVGQPGGSAIGENMSGGNKGLNGFGRSNGAGAIDPGNEAGIPSGDPRFQQDPANALPGNKPAPTLQSPVGTQENQSSSVSTTLAAGARNLTLTGTAAINGTGNDLDNLINGNGAANELRGGAGNDILDGGSGRDQLTGGSGADRFRFATPGAFDTAQADRITDFSRSEGDRIELSRSAFGLAAGATLSFQAVNSDAELTRALGSSSLLIQDLRNGSILFNQNGTVAGAGQGGVFAMVNQGLILQAGDFALGA
jgi:Ca2+-binding RTX toxin-like protein